MSVFLDNRTLSRETAYLVLTLSRHKSGTTCTLVMPRDFPIQPCVAGHGSISIRTRLNEHDSIVAVIFIST